MAKLKREIELGPNPVICQKWQEIEVGWGERPDGFSLHADEAARQRFVDDYWSTMPDTRPAEYSAPDGTAYPVGVCDAVAADVKNSGNGLMFWPNWKTPGSGGIDGWMPKPGPELRPLIEVWFNKCSECGTSVGCAEPDTKITSCAEHN